MTAERKQMIVELQGLLFEAGLDKITVVNISARMDACGKMKEMADWMRKHPDATSLEIEKTHIALSRSTALTR